MDALQKFRSQIDALDNQILTLLHKRMQVVEHIGEFKKTQGLPYRDAARWEEIIASKSSQAEFL
jgi:chorismate mutase